MSEVITPSILAERINKKTGIDADIAKRFSFAFFNLIKPELKTQSTFIIHKFGTFKKVRVEQSTGRNPRTNEQIIIPAHWRIKFTPSNSVAKRLNAKYEHLKAKAIDIPFFKNETLDTEKLESKKSAETVDFNNLSENENTEDKKRTAILIGLGALLLAACLFLLIKLLGCDASKNQLAGETAEPQEKTAEENGAEEIVQAQPVEQKQEEIQKIEEKAENLQDENTKTDEGQIQHRQFLVPAGSCYYKISEKEFKNRHAWPIIYAENAQENPDPDFINAYSNIFIPVINSFTENTEKNKESYLTTYKAYYKLIISQPENKKNPIRQFRAVRVLVSGEIIYPGFLEEFKTQVNSQDYRDAIAIYKNYRP